MQIIQSDGVCWIAYVHSGICWVVVNSLLRAMQVSPDRAFVLTSRVDSQNVLSPQIGQHLQIAGKLKTLPDVIKFDRLIRNAVGDRSFYCLLPESYSKITRFLASHRKCLGFCYYEEGLASYDRVLIAKEQKGQGVLSAGLWKSFKKNLIYQICTGRGAGMPCSFYEFKNPHFIQVFTLFPEAFPGVERKKVVEWNCPVAESTILKPGYLVLPNPFLDRADLAPMALETLREMRKKMEDLRLESLVIRPHPGQAKNSLSFDLVREVFGDWLLKGKAAFSQDPLYLEPYLECFKPVIFHFGSSLGYYAAHLGCRTYCGYARLKLERIGYPNLRDQDRYSLNFPPNYEDL